MGYEIKWSERMPCLYWLVENKGVLLTDISTLPMSPCNFCRFSIGEYTCTFKIRRKEVKK